MSWFLYKSTNLEFWLITNASECHAYTGMMATRRLRSATSSKSLLAAPPDFDDLLETSTQEVILTDANGTEYAKASVPDLLTRVRIWINHPTEPDKVVIGLG